MIQKSHPLGLYVLTFGELCERFSFYGAQAILVLYLVKILHFSDTKSYLFYGAFTTFAYALPVLGGLIADKLIGSLTAVILGGCLLVIGNLLLMLPTFMTFCIGLAILTCGTGLYKSNSSGLIGALYQANDNRRDSGFTLFYMGMNIGAVLGAVIYAFASSKIGWHSGFIVSATGISIALIVFIKTRACLNFSSTHFFYTNKSKFVGYLLILLLCFFVSIIFFHPVILGKLLIVFAGILLTGIVLLAMKYQPIERNRIYALLILSLFAMCFFSASLQVTSSISLFIERNVNRMLFHWEIPTILFSSLYPMAVIVMAPFLSKLWTHLAVKQAEPAMPIKFAMGLLFCSLAFVCFTLASVADISNYLQIVWIVFGNLCLGIGELIIFPTLLAAISRLAPKNLQGTMMGTSFLFVAFAGFISSLIAQRTSYPSSGFISHFDNIISTNIYGELFTEISWVMLGIGLSILCLNPIFKTMAKITNN